MWLRRAQAFVEQAWVVHRRAPGFVATWLAAAEAHASFGYPWVATSRMLTAMGQPSLQAIDTPRREGVARSVQALAVDPNDITFWGLPCVSPLDGQLVVSHGAMVVVDGRYRGEVSLHFRLEELQRQAARWQSGATRDWMVNARQQVLADSALPLQGPAGPGTADTRVLATLAQRLPAQLTQTDLDRVCFSPTRCIAARAWCWWRARAWARPGPIRGRARSQPARPAAAGPAA